MTDVSGSFDIGGREFRFEVTEIVGESGNDLVDLDLAEQLDIADKVLYQLEDDNGEEYHRWLAGPFESIEDIIAAIEDETEEYM